MPHKCLTQNRKASQMVQMNGRPREFDESEVLHRVMNSFWRRGYANTTYDHLVKDSKLSRSSLYNAFGGKDDLFETALELYADELFLEFFKGVNDQENGGEYLRDLIKTFQEPYDPRAKGCLIQKTILQNAASGKKPKQPRTVAACLTGIWQSLTSTLGRLVKRKPRKIDDEERAAMILAIMFGIAVIARNGRNEELVKSITSGTGKLIDLP